MYVAVVPNRGSPPAVLLRESYREDGKTKNRTLGAVADVVEIEGGVISEWINDS